jgi:hypothetical protein
MNRFKQQIYLKKNELKKNLLIKFVLLAIYIM